MPTRFARSAAVVTRKIAGRIVIVPVARGVADLESVYTLNDVGSRIWELLEAEPDLEAITQALVREFDADATTLEADAREFLADLASAGLMREVEPTSGTPQA